VRQQLLDAIYGGQPFRSALRELGLTSNQVWGLAKIDQEWSENLEAGLTTTRRGDLQHGTNAAYVAGCVCSECRAHQRVRMAENRATGLPRGDDGVNHPIGRSLAAASDLPVTQKEPNQ
jgi:hypothetical protein